MIIDINTDNVFDWFHGRQHVALAARSPVATMARAVENCCRSYQYERDLPKNEGKALVPVMITVALTVDEYQTLMEGQGSTIEGRLGGICRNAVRNEIQNLQLPEFITAK